MTLMVYDASIILANIRNEGIPLGRFGHPDEIAETVVWMVKTGYVTNKVVGVDGGWFPQ
jgi:3-oxoacyl-[acyl-carrier protein] reductase